MWHGSSIIARAVKLIPCHGISRSTVTQAAARMSETQRLAAASASHVDVLARFTGVQSAIAIKNGFNWCPISRASAVPQLIDERVIRLRSYLPGMRVFITAAPSFN